MDFEQFIIEMYKNGHSINFIVIEFYKKRNKSYFDDFHNKKIICQDKYFYKEDCRNFVENTILKYLEKQRI